MPDRSLSNASCYCDYNQVHGVYDLYRRPHGLEELYRILAHSEFPLAQQRLLEGGFGTGNYIAPLRQCVKAVHGVEGSDEGCRKAGVKFADTDNVLLQLGNILQLAFNKDCFHAYLVNQVLHHLDTRSDFACLNAFLSEARRVLLPGGQLIINTSSQQQLDPENGVFWNYRYIKNAALRMRGRFIAVEELIERLQSHGYTDIRRIIPRDTLFQKRYYQDPSIVLELSFAKADSVYAFLSPDEILESNEQLREAIANGSVANEMKRAAARRREIGETVFLAARKK